MFYNKKSKGEIATTLTIVAVLLMGAGSLIGARLTRNKTDLQTRAQSSCLITNNPTLVTGGKCAIPLSSVSTDYVCALIYDPSPSVAGGEIVIAGQNSADWNAVWSDTTAKVPLYLKNGQSLDSAENYKLVIWNSVNATDCVREQEYSGSTVVNLFGSPGQPTIPQIPPTATTAPQLTATPAPINTPTPTQTLTPTMSAKAVTSVPTQTPIPTKTPTPAKKPTSTIDLINLCKNITSIQETPAGFTFKYKNTVYFFPTDTFKTMYMTYQINCTQ